MRVNFCPRCGGGVGTDLPASCASCGYRMFLNARPTGGLIVLDDDGERFLSLLRACQPEQGRWELPGGFCDGFEAPADAAVREGREELGAAVVLHDFVGMYVGRYAYQNEVLPVLDAFWLASLADRETVTLDPAESSEMAWFPLTDPPPMAFGTMDRALRDAAGIMLKKGSRGE